MELVAGTVVDRYTIEGALGQGTFAAVFRARHNRLGTLHALKVLQLDQPKIRSAAGFHSRMLVSRPNSTIASGDESISA